MPEMIVGGFWVLVGFLLGIIANEYYFNRGARDLAARTRHLNRVLKAIATGIESALPDAKFYRDDEGDIIGAHINVHVQPAKLTLSTHPATINIDQKEDDREP